MDKATFWATKSPRPEFQAITFEHSAFEAPIRLVANEFAELTLGGHVHTPAPMTIQRPQQKSDTQPRLQIAFPRAVVGREFKRQLARIRDAGIMTPIRVTLAVYLGDTDAPELSWTLYANDQTGIAFTADTVQVTASDDNPMRRAVAPIYDPAEYTGLELI